MTVWTQEYRKEYARAYYAINRDEVLRKKRERESIPEVAEKIYNYRRRPEIKKQNREYTRARRQDDNYVKLESLRDKEFVRKRREKINYIAEYYGCQNAQCAWDAEYKSSHLDFHHINPKAKTAPISLMVKRKLSYIAAEINKCVVLCRNCHGDYHAGFLILEKFTSCKVGNDLEIL